MYLIKKFFMILAGMYIFFIPMTSYASDYEIIYNEAYSRTGNADQSEWISRAILYATDLYNVDPLLITAVMETESGFNFDAVSPAGAIGLMQLMPGTASDIGVNPYDPLDNVIGGVAHISTLLNSFSSSGDLVTNYAMAAYNAGSGAVMAAGGVPAYTETQNYIRRIYDIYMRLSSYEQEGY